MSDAGFEHELQNLDLQVKRICFSFQQQLHLTVIYHKSDQQDKTFSTVLIEFSLIFHSLIDLKLSRLFLIISFIEIHVIVSMWLV